LAGMLELKPSLSGNHPRVCLVPVAFFIGLPERPNKTRWLVQPLVGQAKKALRFSTFCKRAVVFRFEPPEASQCIRLVFVVSRIRGHEAVCPFAFNQSLKFV
jgi:hypothetical protein